MTDQTPIPRNGNGIQWTTDMMLRLSELWHAEYSVTDIGRIMTEEFHVTISRNAAVGKARRLGFPPRTEPKSITEARENSKKARSRTNILGNPRAPRTAFQPTPKRHVDAPLPPDMPIPPGQNEYPSHWRCQWPQVDASKDTLHCTSPRVEGRPYCDCHCRRAYTSFGVEYPKATTIWLSSAGAIRRGQ